MPIFEQVLNFVRSLGPWDIFLGGIMVTVFFSVSVVTLLTIIWFLEVWRSKHRAEGC